MQSSAVIFLPDFFFIQFTLSWHTFEDNFFIQYIYNFLVSHLHSSCIYICCCFVFFQILFSRNFFIIIISFGFDAHFLCLQMVSWLFYRYFFFFFLYSTIIFEIFFCEIATGNFSLYLSLKCCWHDWATSRIMRFFFLSWIGMIFL